MPYMRPVTDQKAKSARAGGSDDTELWYWSLPPEGWPRPHPDIRIHGFRHRDQVQEEAGPGERTQRHECRVIARDDHDPAGNKIRQRGTNARCRGYRPEADIEMSRSVCDVLYDKGKQRPENAGSDTVEQLHAASQ